MPRVWFVTGSSSGFGLEICKQAAARGDFVVATARNPASLGELTTEFPDNILAVQLDVTKGDEIAKAAEEALAWKGNIDILVNNAGIGNIGAIEDMSDADYRKLFDINVFGLINVTKAFLPKMREQKSGHIMNFSSVAGFFTMPGFGPYCATKHAVEALSDALSSEVAPLGIHVTAIEPGAFRTKFIGNVIDSPTNPDYEATVAPTREMLNAIGKTAKGDPAKAAAAVLKIADMEKPPLRLPLGNDAMEWLGPRMDAVKEQLHANEALSRSTDFE